MRLSLDLDLPELGPLLANLLPLGVAQPESLQLDDSTFKLNLRAKLVGLVCISAQVSKRASGITLHSFDLTGASFASGALLASLRSKLSELDTCQNSGGIRLHIWGESDGERLHLEWS